MNIRLNVLSVCVDEGCVGPTKLFNPKHGISGVKYCGTYNPEEMPSSPGTAREESDGVYAYYSRIPDPVVPDNRLAIIRVTIAELPEAIRLQVIAEQEPADGGLPQPPASE